MKWPWSDRVAEAVRSKEEADAQGRAISMQWDFINEQIERLRAHKEQNHFTEIVIQVARGGHK